MEVLPPHINESFAMFGVVKESLSTKTPRIRFGLSAIKNVGSAIVEAIIKERKENGPYLGIEDMLRRVKHKDLNKKSLEALIKTGALDDIDERNTLLTNLETLLQFARTCQRDAKFGQDNLFGNVGTPLPSLRLETAEPADTAQRLIWEKELLGMYISDHPLKQYMPLLKSISTPVRELKKMKDKEHITVAGIITDIHRIVTKRGSPMAFVTIEDATTTGEIILFPETMKSYNDTLLEDATILVTGTVSTRDGEWKIIADTIRMFNPEQLVKHSAVALKLPPKMKKEDFDSLQEVLKANPGPAPVHVQIGPKRMKAKSQIQPSEEVIEQIKAIVGKNRVALVYLKQEM